VRIRKGDNVIRLLLGALIRGNGSLHHITGSGLCPDDQSLKCRVMIMITDIAVTLQSSGPFIARII
jgi:hypothetical protein